MNRSTYKAGLLWHHVNTIYYRTQGANLDKRHLLNSFTMVIFSLRQPKIVQCRATFTMHRSEIPVALMSSVSAHAAVHVYGPVKGLSVEHSRVFFCCLTVSVYFFIFCYLDSSKETRDPKNNPVTCLKAIEMNKTGMLWAMVRRRNKTGSISPIWRNVNDLEKFLTEALLQWPWREKKKNQTVVYTVS